MYHLSSSYPFPLVPSPSSFHPASRHLQRWWWWCPCVVIVYSSRYLKMFVSNKKMKQKRKLMQGPRDVNSVSWASLCHPCCPCLLGSCTLAPPLTPQAVAHSGCGGAVLMLLLLVVPSCYCCWPLLLPSLLIIALPWCHQPSSLLASIIHPRSRGRCGLIPFFLCLPLVSHSYPSCTLFLPCEQSLKLAVWGVVVWLSSFGVQLPISLI